MADTLLRIAEPGAFSPHWSAAVLDELGRNLVEHAGLDPEAATRRIAHMQAAFPNADVTGYAHLISSMTCNEEDRHVVAAAARGRCEIVVTFNLSDFPPAALRGYRTTRSAAKRLALVEQAATLGQQLHLGLRQLEAGDGVTPERPPPSGQVVRRRRLLVDAVIASSRMRGSGTGRQACSAQRATSPAVRCRLAVGFPPHPSRRIHDAG